jgi:TRAP transporter 4TM/12TM fusion protein
MPQPVIPVAFFAVKETVMRELKGFWKWIARALVTAWVILVLRTALLGAWHPVIQGSIFLTFGMAVVYLLYPISKKRMSVENPGVVDRLIFGTTDSPAILDIIIMIASLTVCLYVPLNWDENAQLSWDYKTHELVFSAILVLSLLEATRRTTGNIIPILVGFFLFYALFGQHIPGFFGHPGFPLVEILNHFYMMTEGVWGLLTDLTSRVIAVFLILGPVLLSTGVGQTFMDLARFFGGRIDGGAGQIAVLSSAFFGMLSGSAVANVATTGTFTIPTMKKLGYNSELAGAIESSASCGGQIMPPIMGVGAFVMAEVLGVPYLSVVVAAIIPALIYFFGVGCGVYFFARKYGLGKLPPEMVPKAKDVFSPKNMVSFIIPIGILLYMLVRLLPPQMAAGWALVATMVVFMMIGGPLSSSETRERALIIARAFFSGTTSALAYLMIMAVCVQMAVSLISLTGLAVKMSEIILGLAGFNIMLALFATMITTMVLGMGMPTTAAYIIAGAVLGGALIGLGIEGLAGHLFIFYFAVLANISPPVCVAIFTAVTISGGKWIRMAFLAMGLCIAAYLIPYIFVFHTSLLMKGSLLSIISAAVTAGLGTLFLSSAVAGHFTVPASRLERLLFAFGGGFLIYPSWATNGTGVVLIGIALFSHLVAQQKRMEAAG